MNSLITDQEFVGFQRIFYQASGIKLCPGKKALVASRLAKRLRHLQLSSYGDYLRLIGTADGAAEMRVAVDLLTTNETYFFREEKHFELLRELASAERERARPFRVWSAASSTGEEAYSIAMVLADCLGMTGWEVLGSDLSERVLARARTGHYSLQRTGRLPQRYLKQYCLRGVGAQEGTLLIGRALRSRVRFLAVNLNAALPSLGRFDVIFLRNVMIYFDEGTKRGVLTRILDVLKEGGYLLIGHSESLQKNAALQQCVPSVYRKL